MPGFHTLEREKAFRYPSSEGPQYPAIHDLVKPHIASFDALFEGAFIPDEGKTSLNEGLLDLAVKDLDPKVIFSHDEEGAITNRLEIKFDKVMVSKPYARHRGEGTTFRQIYPSEARERLTTYASSLSGRISWTVNGVSASDTIELGDLPIMVKSNRCNLFGLPPSELVKHHEEAEEMGGYFIINGNERLIRFLIIPRRNHVTSIVRGSFQNRGPSYSEFGVAIRCARPDQTSQTNTLHYLTSGSATLRFSWRKSEYMVPVVMIMRALVGATDEEIFKGIIQKDYENTFMTDRIEVLLRMFKRYGLRDQQACLAFLGSKFRVTLQCPEDWSDARVGQFLCDRVILVHLTDAFDKFNLLLFMMRKLYSLVKGDCCADNPDSPQHQEILMPGFLYGMIIKEKLDEYLQAVRLQVNQDFRLKTAGTDLTSNAYISKTLRKVNHDIGKKLQYFLATGNLVSPSGLDLQQAAGYTIVAEKLNFTRFISHFRSVHRGAFFAELKTTTVRKLLPEAWGFLCPVHTPDGGPCGLLNHFAYMCRLTTEHLDAAHIPALLASLGMTEPVDVAALDGQDSICVQLDGRIIGYASAPLAVRIANTLRLWKTEGSHRIPRDLEIGLVPYSEKGQYPGLYLFASRGRMMRDVRYLRNGQNDSVGPFEQVYLDIACMEDEVEKGMTTHQEHAPTHMLSLLANLTPFSDYNQSPRNMYQCQMSKQTMGTPSTVLNHRTDNKLYRLQTGQTPIVRPALHDSYGMDGFPNGTNAIVAVISYTGYDMEDAMIINKSAHERGFGHGSIYKSHITDLKNVKVDKNSGSVLAVHFGLGRDIRETDPKRQNLDSDGLPFLGTRLTSGDVICAYVDRNTGKTLFDKYKGDEAAYVEEVRLIGNDGSDAEAAKLHVKLRIARPPVIGDKFSSRHGQKGVCSQKYPAVDMPFTESGMQPDVIINPHAFPSRMTIGMFVESIAAKAGALHGLAQDGTPFAFSEDDTPGAYFGEQLVRAGYNYHGNEPMYSGITGEEFHADIYIGVVYYQRLRHMVGDKWQVRTTGPIDQVTRQPVKGRKRGGGIRFGEMERDALLAHGTSFLLQDRLMNCSDYSLTYVCRTCGSMASLGYAPTSAKVRHVGQRGDHVVDDFSRGTDGQFCRVCAASGAVPAKPDVAERFRINRPGNNLDVVPIPFVFKLLVAELASMGINLRIKTT